MNALIALSIRHRLVLVALAALALAFGLNTLRDVPLDVFPEFVAPQVTVQVEAPGLTPEQVEQRVTTPLEAALAGAPGLDRSEEHTSELQSLMRISYAVFCLKK